MNLEKLEKILKDEPKFRLKQAKRAVFIDLIENWSQATNFPLALREKLNQECPLAIKAEVFKSDQAASFKILLYLDDGLKIESVLLNHANGRHTVCVSSQVGCPLGCKFCATGQMGYKRNLTSSEIIEQVLFFQRFLKNNLPDRFASLARHRYAAPAKLSPRLLTPEPARLASEALRARPVTSRRRQVPDQEGNRVTNVVFMGMGEPFLNYDHVLAAIKMLNDKDSFNIGARHLSISTVGVIGGIKKLAKESMQINLAWSLHAPNDELRSQLIPADKKYPLADIMAELNEYLKQSGRRVMIEYLMLENFNDRPDQAKELAELLKKINPPLYFVNLIAYNPTSNFKASSEKRIKAFKLALNKQGIEVTERYRLGRDIKAACGQLAGNNISFPSKGGQGG